MFHNQIHSYTLHYQRRREKLSTIFGAFEQADTSTTRQYGGTGLGLAISAQLVGLMGGELAVDSKVGQGTTFHFSLPFERGPELKDRFETVSTFEGIPVLVVDDNRTNRRIFEQILTNWQMSVTLVDGARAAMKAMEDALAGQKPYSLVLTDVFMPEVDGLGLVSWIRERPEFAKTHVIMITSARTSEHAAHARELNVAAYLSKPVKQSSLLEAIGSAVWGGRADAATPRRDEEKTSQQETGGSLSILLAEDNAVNRKMAVRMLERLGHSSETANNGKEAVDFLREKSFDLVLMDVQMPEMDGLTATGVIRESEKETGRHVPIIAMTAHAMKGDRERCLDAGMDGYICKPFKRPELAEAIEIVMTEVNEAKKAAEHQTPHEGDIIDREDLMERVDDDMEFLEETIELYHEDRPELMSGIRDAIEGNDSDSLRITAHTLKGLVGNFCAQRTFDAAFVLEQKGREGNLTGAAEAYADLENEIDMLNAALTSLVNGS